MSENINLNINISGQKEAEKTAKSVENIGKSANKTSNYMTDLRKQLREAKSAMLQAEEGSKTYNQALARVADIQFRIKDSGEKARLAIMDVGAVSKNVGGALAGIAGGFQTVAGAMTLFGLEGEASLKVIQNLTSIISVVQGLTAFADVIDNLRDLFIGMKASAAAAQGGVEGIGGSIEKLSPQVTNATTNLAGMTNANNLLNTALQKSIDLKEDDSIKLERLLKLENIYSGNEKMSAKIKADLTALEEKYGGVVDRSTVSIREQNAALNTVNNTTKTVATGFTSMGKSILVSFGWTAVILAALAAITYGVTKLIDWLNEIPKDVEINLQLNEEVSKKLVENIDKARLFALDYYKAVKEKDGERIKELELYAQKEFNIHKNRLKQIGENVNTWRDAFKQYLKIAQDTYYNEALSKRKSEADVSRNLAKQQIEDLKAAMYKEYGPVRTDKIIQGRGVALWGLAKKYKDAVETFNAANQDILNLNKIAFKAVDMGIGAGTKETKPTTTTVTPKVEKVYWSASALKGLKEEMDRQIMSDIQKNIKEFQLQNIPKAPGFQIPKGEILGTTPEYYQKQLDTLQRSYDMGLTDYKDYLTVKSHILENAESFDIQLTETSFQTRMEIMQMERDAFEQRMQMYQDWTTSLGEITDAISSIYDARMTSLDNYYNAEKALIEQSTMSEEQKNKRLSELDQERYQKQKELFEQQKSWQIASVMLNLFGGLMGVFTRATTPVAMGGLPTPFNWITAGLEAAGLSATAIAQIANINAQQLEAPGGGGSAGGSAAPTAMLSAVSPTQTSTTSSAEILNKINKEADKPENVVKVSEINKVQTKTKVKETNQNY